MPINSSNSVQASEAEAYLSSSYRNNSPRLSHTYQAEILKGDPSEFNASLRLYRSIETRNENTKVERLENCRTYSWFVRNKESGQVRVRSNHCRLRWCPMCSKLKSYFVYLSVTGWLQQINEPKLLTLTLRHSNSSLYQQINDIYYFFRQLRKIRWLKKAIRGGIWFFQIKWIERTKSWHPHLHVLLDSAFLPQSELSETWCKVTHGSYIVDIRTVRDPEETAKYVSRYVSRPAELSSLTLSLAKQVFHALHGKRLAGSWGTAFGCNLSGKPPETDEEFEKIANWSTVRENQGYDPRADKIIAAWRTGEALPADINFVEEDEFIENGEKNCFIDYNYDDLIPE